MPDNRQSVSSLISGESLDQTTFFGLILKLKLHNPGSILRIVNALRRGSIYLSDIYAKVSDREVFEEQFADWLSDKPCLRFIQNSGRSGQEPLSSDVTFDYLVGNLIANVRLREDRPLAPEEVEQITGEMVRRFEDSWIEGESLMPQKAPGRSGTSFYVTDPGIFAEQRRVWLAENL